MNNNPTFKRGNTGPTTVLNRIGLAVLGILLVSLVGTTTLDAQRDLNFYHFANVMQRSQMNPSFIPNAKLTVGAPFLSSIGVGGSNNGFSYRQAGVMNALTGSRKLDFEMALSSIAEQNFIGGSGEVEIFGIGYRLGKHFFYGSLSDHVETSINYPYGAIEILADDQNDVISQGGFYDLRDLMFQASHYRAMSLAYAREFSKKFNLGVRVRILTGLENVYSTNNGLIFNSFEGGSSTSEPGYEVEGNIAVMGAGIYRFQNDKRFPLYVAGNYGASVDLGIQYKVNEDLELSASASNFGLLKWNSELTNAEIGDPMILPSQLDTFLTDYIDQVADDLATMAEGRLPAYQTKLTGDIYAGLKYQVMPEQFFGVVANARFYPNRVDIGAAFSYQMKVLKWLHAGGSYAVFNNSFINLGLGLTIDLGPLQGYFSTDNVLGLVSPGTTQATNVRMGLNVIWGRGYEEKREEEQIAQDLEEAKRLAEEALLAEQNNINGDTVQGVRPHNFEGYFMFRGTTKSSASGQVVDAAYVDIYKINGDGFRELIHTSRYPNGEFDIVLFAQPGTHEMHVENWGFQKEIYQFRATKTTLQKEFMMIPKPIMDSPARPVAVNTSPSYEDQSFEEPLGDNTASEDVFDEVPAEGDIAQARGIFLLTQKTSLREEATSGSSVMKRLDVGEQVLLVEETNKFWWKVKFGERIGFVKAALLEPGQ